MPMSTNIFSLITGDTKPFLSGPIAEELHVYLNGRSAKSVKKKTELVPGMLVAEHADPKKGDVHTPVAGVVTDITEHAVIIKVQPSTETAPEAVQPIDFSTVPDSEMAETLKKLGLDLPLLVPVTGKDPIMHVIAGLNPEPGLCYAEAMLANCKETLEAGIAMLSRFLPPVREIVLATHDASITLKGCNRTVAVPPVYPNEHRRILMSYVTGSEKLKAINTIDIHALYILGRVAQTGLPVTETVITVMGKNYLVPIGTPIDLMLAHAGVTVHEDDRVIVGGPFRGYAIKNITQGIAASDTGITVVPNGATAPISDNACLHCGECVRHCPMRLRPNLLSRYSEFDNYAQCKTEFVRRCIECGLCTYWCPARRPVAQLIKLAKQHSILHISQNEPVPNEFE